MIPPPTPTGSYPNPLDKLPLPKALLMTRIIWAALILGQVAFMAVEAVILSQPQPPGRPPAAPLDSRLLFFVNLAMLVLIVPVMYFLRASTFKRSRAGNNGTLMPSAYSTGNIIFWAGCEGCSFFGLVVALINRNFWPTIFIVAIALALQVITFPRLGDLQSPNETFKIE